MISVVIGELTQIENCSYFVTWKDKICTVLIHEVTAFLCLMHGHYVLQTAVTIEEV